MIAELYLLLDLLEDTVADTPISPPSAKPQAITPAQATKQIFGLGEITQIPQSITLPTSTPKEVARSYLFSAVGKPESWAKKLETGRL